LRYINNKPLFLKIKFISTPGHRKYYSKQGLISFKKSLGGNANILLYTSFGLKTLKFAENLTIGGEISYVLYE
jgi:ribosomal protein S8